MPARSWCSPIPWPATTESMPLSSSRQRCMRGRSSSALASEEPDLIVLSPGPGDPARMGPHIALVRQLATEAIDGGPPILGICLGHQLLALAAEAPTRRLAVGHHGGNHAVMELDSG